MTALDYRHQFEREVRGLPDPDSPQSELVAALPKIEDLIFLAQKSGCGYYSSAGIERVLCALAETIDACPAEEVEPGHILFVMSEAYDVGGHTRVAERWIEADASHRYSLVLTRQPSSRRIPQRLAESVRKSGGEVMLLDRTPDVLSRAARLRTVAGRFDKVVLLVHTDDILPVLAFGTERFTRPVGLYDHADHLFWIGATIADRVGELRKSGAEFSRLRRGIENPCLVGIPPELRATAPSVALGRRSDLPPVVITCGNAEKYRPVMGIDFMKPVEEILRRVPTAQFLGIGMTFREFPEWRAVNRRVGGRIRLLGSVPYDSLLAYYGTAAVYLDSRPMAGGTAITDALCSGCPVLSYPGPVGQMDWVFDSPALCRSDEELADRAVAILMKEVDVEELFRRESAAYARHNSHELFKGRIAKFLSTLTGPHRLQPISPQFNGLSELDKYHYAMNSGRETVWRGLGRIFNVHYEVSPLVRRKIVEVCGLRFCVKTKKLSEVADV